MNRITTSAAIGLCLCALLYLSSFIALAPALGWNDMRLVPSFYLAAGLDIYGKLPELGLTTLYGPAMAVSFLPATLATTPTSAICLASLIAVAFGFVSVLVPSVSLVKILKAKLSNQNRLLLLSLPIAMALILRSTGYSSFSIHADSPAICALSLAAWAVVNCDKKWSHPLAAFLVVYAMLCKVVYGAGIPALVLAVWWTHGRRLALQQSVWLLAFLAATLGVCAAHFGMREMIDAMIAVPQAHPWNLYSQFDSTYAKGIGSTIPWKILCLVHLTTLMVTAWLLPFVVLRIGWAFLPSHDLAGPERSIRNWAKTLLVFAACLTPGGILGFSKLGGDINALGAPVHFLLLLGLSMLLPHAATLLNHRAIQHAAVLTVIVLSLRLLNLAGINWLRTDFRLYDRIQQTMHHHPDEIWFYTRPLAHWFFEKQDILSGDVLYCYELAGRKFDSVWIKNHLPSKFGYAAAYKFDPSAKEAPKIIQATAREAMVELGNGFNVFAKIGENLAPVSDRKP